MRKITIILFILLLVTPFSVFGAVDIVQDSTLKTNLQGCWEMEEESGTRIDAHANGNDLVDNNTVLFGDGIIDNGADFELDNSEYLSIADGDQTGVKFTGSFTLSAWYKLENAPVDDGAAQHIVNRLQGSDGYMYRYYQTGGQFRIRTQVSNAATNENKEFALTLTEGVFTHVVFRFTSSSKEHSVWINGSEESPQTGTVNPAAPTSEFRIGAEAENVAGFADGILDVVAVWSTALSDTSIGDLYNSGIGIPCSAGGEEVQNSQGWIIGFFQLIIGLFERLT